MKLATLEIEVQENRIGSHFEPSPDGVKPHRLILAPLTDYQGLMSMGVDIRKEYATVVAHELSHFVAHISGVASHQFTSAGQYYSGEQALQGEKDAWDISNHMVTINNRIKDTALGSYEKRVAQEKLFKSLGLERT